MRAEGKRRKEEWEKKEEGERAVMGDKEKKRHETGGKFTNK